MYGHGAAPPPRTDGAAVALRVLFAGLSVLSCGLLASVPLFRIAYLRRRTVDWVIASVALPVTFALFAVVGSLPEADRRTDVALALILIIGAGAAVYFVVFDLRRTQAAPPVAPYPPTAQTVGYGYPPVQQQPQPQQQAPQPPYLHPTVPQSGPPVHQHPTLGTTGHQPTPVPNQAPTPVPAPPPAQPQPEQGQPPHRIDQVRAELDELSDYLRRQEDGGR